MIDIFSISYDVALHEWHKTLLMTSQHWFMQWLHAVKQQTITWSIVDQDLWHHMVSQVQIMSLNISILQDNNHPINK